MQCEYWHPVVLKTTPAEHNHVAAPEAEQPRPWLRHTPSAAAAVWSGLAEVSPLNGSE
jgi:hypothetical protein